jgi:DHA1 family bicyclomycin/chloramphenicol resistance-like MFS transporter
MKFPTPLKPVPFAEFVAMQAMLIAIVAFSIDAMLPVLPEIGADLSSDAVNKIQLVVTSFILGLGVGTLFAGPLSDTFGRKPVMFCGLAVYVLAALAGALASSIEWLLFARFVQGLGAAGPRAVNVAIIRDLYKGRAMARVMSFVMTVFVLVPAIAPSFGAVLAAFAGWRSLFVSFMVFGLISGAWIMLRQPETLLVENRRPFTARRLWGGLKEVLGSRLVLTYIAVMSLAYGQMFAWLSSAPQIFADVYDRAGSFPLWFAAIALFAGLASIMNANLVMRLGMRALATWAFATMAVASVVMLGTQFLTLPAPYDFAIFIVYLGTSFFMIGLTFGNLNALALEQVGHIAGLAAAVVGAVSTVLAVLIAVPIGQAYSGTPLPVISGILVCSTLAFGLMLTTRE